MQKRLWVVIMLTIATLLPPACVHMSKPGASTMLVRLAVLRSGNMTDNANRLPGGIWISGQKQLAAIVSRLQQGQILTKDIVLSEIDFNEDGVLLVWMGQKNTGGYALALMADHADINNDDVRVPIRWIAPQKGQVVSQMMTHPFLMVKMTKGLYAKVIVIDQNSLEKVVVDIK